MARFLELDPEDLREPATSLSVRAGDLLKFSGTGGSVVSGGGTVERLGVYKAAVLTTAGTVLSPEGPPSIVVFAARASGHASIDVMVGDPYGEHAAVRVEVVVEP